MSIAAGIFISITAACTSVWAVAGDQVARAFPIIRRVADYIDGGFRVPTDAQVDELVAASNRRRDDGLHDRDDMMPGDDTSASRPCALESHMTWSEWLDSECVLPLVSDAAIEAAPQFKPGLLGVGEVWSEDGRDVVGYSLPAIPPPDGVVGWLRGGYNMPSETEIDAAAPHTQRGRQRGHCPRGWVFEDENPQAHAESTAMLHDIGPARATALLEAMRRRAGVQP